MEFHLAADAGKGLLSVLRFGECSCTKPVNNGNDLAVYFPANA